MPHQTHPNTFTAWHPVLRPLGRALAAVLFFNALAPLSVLAQDKGQTPYNPVAQAQLRRLAALQQDIEHRKATSAHLQASISERTSRSLARAQELITVLQKNNTPAQQQELQTELQAIDNARDAILGELDATRSELVQRKLPAEIIQRHDQATDAIRSQSTELSRYSTAWSADPSSTNLAALARYFTQYPAGPSSATPTGRTPRGLTPKDTGLPWRTPSPNTRAPAETQTAWHQTLYGDQQIQLAQAGGSNIGGIQFNIPPEPGQAPTPADLAETDETHITPAIRAKATELGNNPVAISNWVRNTIDYSPTWGAIQSAQDTLDKQRGNAFDISSLTIALLRAAKIPARYQFGTIELDIAKAQNWVGGTTNPNAALQLLNQGGIAATGQSQGGQIKTIRMEHVWVEAYVNWQPSRGAMQGGSQLTPPQHVNPNGPLNAWVPLDASYKQYSYSPGQLQQNPVPLDSQALLSAAQQGATINEAEGWVQNLNQTAIQNQLNAYQNQLKTSIEQNNPNATVGDVIGKKIIQERNPDMLAGASPYKILLKGSQNTAIPSALQHQFVYKLYASAYDQADDTPLLNYSEKTSQLVGKRLTLSYIPASQADADLIASYLPKPHTDGTPIQPSELPSSLPGYLIRLKPQITLDGQVVATSSESLPMGTDLKATGGFTQLWDPTQWDLSTDSSNTVGQATAIGISAGGISQAQLTQLKDRLTAAKAKLEAQNITGLSGEQISGDMLTANIWSWFVESENHNKLSQNQAGMIEVPGLSYGLFHAVAQPIYSWGVVRQVKFPGVNMDIGHIRNLSWAKDNKAETWVSYNRIRGQYMSLMEGVVPERIFSDPNQCNIEGRANPNPALPICAQGISAVKVIAIASQAGQKIYTITRAVYENNPNIVSSKLGAHSQNTQSRVQNALNAGYEVTIHERPITQNEWTGSGFTTIDPATGAGAYTIEGGD